MHQQRKQNHTFQRVSSSKLVLKSVENCSAALNYNENGSKNTAVCECEKVYMLCECLYVCVYVCMLEGITSSFPGSSNPLFLQRFRSRLKQMYMCMCVCVYIHIYIYVCVCVCVCVLYSVFVRDSKTNVYVCMYIYNICRVFVCDSKTKSTGSLQME
jgi:hypothetical protein